MRDTNWLEKLSASIVNILFVGLVALAMKQILPNVDWRVLFVTLFFIFSLVSLAFPKKRDLGMAMVGSFWKQDYPLQNLLLYTILYTISFTTIFIWIFFPFDLLLLNLTVQVVLIRFTGTTLHGFIAGNMTTVKNNK